MNQARVCGNDVRKASLRKTRRDDYSATPVPRQQSRSVLLNYRSDPSPDGVAGGGIQSVERALRILVAFGAPEQQLTVGELSRMLDVHKSTASRLVATLVSTGFLERGLGDAQLRLGPELARLGRLADDGRGLADAARPIMDELAAETGETVTLSVADCHEAVTIAQSEASFAIGVQTWLGQRSPLHCTSDGKVLLAFAAAELGAGTLERRTSDTITEPRALAVELARVRERGWATATGDFEAGLHGAAAPVLDAAGRCRAAVCVSGPAYRIGADALPALGDRCRAAAARIALSLR